MFPVQLCPSPPDITNTVKVSSGFSNGSLAVYTCEPGFVANDEVPYISCNGTHWTNTLFECSDENFFSSLNSCMYTFIHLFYIHY